MLLMTCIVWRNLKKNIYWSLYIRTISLKDHSTTCQKTFLRDPPTFTQVAGVILNMTYIVWETVKQTKNNGIYPNNFFERSIYHVPENAPETIPHSSGWGNFKHINGTYITHILLRIYILKFECNGLIIPTYIK
jgi:hypothetical protein